MRNIFLILIAMATPFSFGAVPAPRAEGIYDTKNKAWLTVDELAARLNPGAVMVFGEEHFVDGSEKNPSDVQHHHNQTRWLEALRLSANARGFKSVLGMEFLEYPYQNTVDTYLAGNMTDEEFTTAIHWGKNPFDAYKEILWTSPTRALNIPRSIVHDVAFHGRESLNAEQIALLPPIWERGSDTYFERFMDVMGGHGSAQDLESYFIAHCLWDDTMAWKSTQSLEMGEQVLTIVVGAFHVEFGHGLPARLKRYGVNDVHTMVQMNIPDFADKEDFVKPDPDYGDRADYIWVYSL
jgi:uncharacterized iron-regulated protein